METIKISDLKPHPDNPRTISPKELLKLIDKLKRDPEFMEARGIVVDQENVVWAGNMKVVALEKMGHTEVEVQRMDETWTEEEKREFMIKDNLHYGYFDWGTIKANTTEDELVVFGLLDEIKPTEPKEQKEYEPSYIVTLPVRAEVYDEVKSTVDNMREQAIDPAKVIEEALEG